MFPCIAKIIVLFACVFGKCDSFRITARSRNDQFLFMSLVDHKEELIKNAAALASPGINYHAENPFIYISYSNRLILMHCRKGNSGSRRINQNYWEAPSGNRSRKFGR